MPNVVVAELGDFQREMSALRERSEGIPPEDLSKCQGGCRRTFGGENPDRASDKLVSLLRAQATE